MGTRNGACATVHFPTCPSLLQRRLVMQQHEAHLDREAVDTGQAGEHVGQHVHVGMPGTARVEHLHDGGALQVKRGRHVGALQIDFRQQNVMFWSANTDAQRPVIPSTSGRHPL